MLVHAKARKLVERAGREARDDYALGRRMMIALGGLALVLGASFAFWVTSSINRPLKIAVNVAKQIAQGARFTFLPKSPVGPGDTWNAEEQTPFAMGGLPAKTILSLALHFTDSRTLRHESRVLSLQRVRWSTHISSNPY